MKENRKLHMFLLVLAGILISAMLVMMRLGGSVNFRDFMSAGRVYDISPVNLQNHSSAWKYDQEKHGYWLLSDKASKRFRLDGRERTWNHLYLTIKETSKEPLTGMVRYYGKDKRKLYQQPIELYKGKNAVPLDETVPAASLAIVFQGAQGEFVSISEMQVRTTPSWFTLPHFLKLFTAAFAGVITVLMSLLFLKRRFLQRREGKITGVLLDSLQAEIQVAGDFLGERLGGRLSVFQRESIRKLLFSILFLWMVIGNVAGWLRDGAVFRYHVLICVLLLLAISFISWERPLQKQSWKTPLMRSWLGIWMGVIICDLFVVRSLEFETGLGMLLSGSVFIFFWQNMEQKDRMLKDLMAALEITFFIGIIYCMVFRAKKPAIDYNGMFTSPEELAMYAVLMEIVFLTRMDWLIARSVNGSLERGREDGALFFSCFKNILGGSVSLFLVLRSGHTPGIFIFALIAICYLPGVWVKLFHHGAKCRKLCISIIAAAILSYGCTCLVFASTKYLPEILDLNLQYRQELLTTRLKGEEKELFVQQYPGSLQGARMKHKDKLPVIWRNYARRLNLFGHSGSLSVFREVLPAYSGYLDMAFHHGIFILLPYAAYQISIILAGAKYAFHRKGSRNICMYFLGIAYLSFSICANVEISWGHPMWLCYYLSAGYLGGDGGGALQITKIGKEEFN